MDERSLRPLEFDKIREMLANQAATSLGHELAMAIRPSGERDQVAAWLAETAEAHAVLQSGDRPPLGGVTDIREPLKRAELGGSLQGPELLAIGEFIRAARAMRGFLRDRGRDCPGLAGLAATMSPPDEVSRAIGLAITEEGAVSDDASPRLAGIRRSIRVLSDRIRERMNSFLRNQEHLKALQEPIITIREGRFVLPVRNDSRNVIPGVVHDVSSSGATVFVEPLSCVQHNNDLRRLAGEEEDEVRRILAELSLLVGAHAGEIAHIVVVMARIDFCLAKARLALAMRATQPELAASTYVDLPSARHPLIPSADVVPVDVRIGRDFTVLVITGPNTGGKTVTLKTVGLLSLMAQSGLFVPAGRGAVVTVFDEILADIGDEQSIEQSLSTFSSHLTAIIRILGVAGPRSLVLLDEIGAGTDPTEGAALATALLEEFHARGCRTIATTHYGQLKEFAYSHSGVANASVSFDPDTLAPTFRLNIGVPGPSNALAIARRLGLARSIVNRAKELVGEDQIKIEEMIQRLLAERERLAAERDDLAVLRRQAAALRLELEAEGREQRDRWNQAMARVRGEMRDAVVAARKEFDALVKELRALASADDRRAIERGITELRERFRDVREAAEQVVGDDRPGETAAGRAPAAGALQPGLLVRVPRLGQTGYVLAVPDAQGQVPVQVGIMRVMVRADDLVIAEEPGTSAVPRGQMMRSAAGAAGEGGAALAGAKLRAFAPEIDLRGQTVEEAVPQVDKYIDDAVLAGVKQIRIIHGKGTGALREGINSYLRSHASVASLTLAPLNEGGDGVTVVELR